MRYETDGLSPEIQEDIRAQNRYKVELQHV